ncbi:hypothetical protein FRB94_009473 [Tulasnella sp. JGI-2019a]|nr:hypothetical protein FRB94_009473 [Tulasnella sp. JGI-2019a]
MEDSTPPLSPPGSSSGSSDLTEEEEIPIQPAFFYPSGHNNTHHLDDDDNGYLSPDQDPFAARGIPVFKPTYEEFRDFEKYMERVEIWGRRSGIVKVIPPKEWSDALPPVKPLLSTLKLKHPIEQHMVGQSGLFRQSNVEKRRKLTVKDWVDLCNQDDRRAPAIKDGEVQKRPVARTRKARAGRKPKGEVVNEDAEPERVEEGDHLSVNQADNGPVPELEHASIGTVTPTVDATPTADGPSAKAGSSKADASPDLSFYNEFEPRASWLPKDTSPEDYTPEACRELERLFWRSCGIGIPAQYGADMSGSLFTKDTTEWNVAQLPSFLSRLCLNKSLPGVNTPYLYFGMWRATFAWHVEDMDLYSINYIHWGAPKYWYAIPNGRSKAFEDRMKGFFPGDSKECPQYLRHKSYLVSPTLLSQSALRPNTLVQHQGEFVITYPRGYHAGFNLGLNCAESVNFALDSWIELGRKADVCRCVGDSVRIDVDQLLAEAERQREEEKMQKLLPNYDAMVAASKRKSESQTGDQPKRKRVKKDPTAFSTSNITVISNGRAESGQASASLKPRIRIPAVPVTPCCLCATNDPEGLLPVNDPPAACNTAKPFTILQDGEQISWWRAHEKCARAIPETWVDEVDGKRVVFGVDGIHKDRWALKCAECSKAVLKVHGAKVQCTRGKCSKAFHVMCAVHAEDVSYRELEEVEKDIILMDPEAPPVDPVPILVPETDQLGSDPAPLPPLTVPQPNGPKIIRTIRKPIIELLCSQHNPVVQERRKLAKQEKIRQEVLALPSEARIRIKNSSGLCEVTLVSVNEERKSVIVLWTDGDRKEFQWTSIVWSDVPEGTIVRKVAEEVAQSKAMRPAVTATATTSNGSSYPKLAPYPAMASASSQQSRPRAVPTVKGAQTYSTHVPGPVPSTSQPAYPPPSLTYSPTGLLPYGSQSAVPSNPAYQVYYPPYTARPVYPPQPPPHNTQYYAPPPPHYYYYTPPPSTHAQSSVYGQPQHLPAPPAANGNHKPIYSQPWYGYPMANAGYYSGQQQGPGPLPPITTHPYNHRPPTGYSVPPPNGVEPNLPPLTHSLAASSQGQTSSERLQLPGISSLIDAAKP